MALQIWFPDDVRQILTALQSAGANNGDDYQRALRDVGLAFGVELARPRYRREVRYETSAVPTRDTYTIVMEDEAADARMVSYEIAPLPSGTYDTTYFPR